MNEQARAIDAPHGVGSLRRLRWRWRMAIVRGRLDMHDPRMGSVRTTIERHCPHQDAKKIERAYLGFRRRYPLVNRWLLQGTPYAESVVQIEGLHHLEEALSGGTGAILASAHFGHGRLIKPVLGLHGRPALLVGAGPGGRRWPAFAAEDLPVSLNLRPHFAALRENKPLIVLLDGHIEPHRAAIAVLGIGVGFAPGPMRIASAAGAPVLPTFVVDEGTLRDPLAIRLVIHPPLALQTSDDAAADALENLRSFAAVYAQELSRNPHNIKWHFVDPESGRYSPRRGIEPWDVNPELAGEGAGAAQRASPAHGR